MKGPTRPPGMEPGGRPHDARAQVELDREMDRLRAKRDAGRWSMVVGIGMMFFGSQLWIGVAVGGALMTLWGAAVSVYYSRRMARLEDPWDDPEIDAWEQELIEELERERRSERDKGR